MKRLEKTMISLLLVLSMVLVPLSACKVNSGNPAKTTAVTTPTATDTTGTPNVTTPNVTDTTGTSDAPAPDDPPTVTTDSSNITNPDDPVPQGKARIKIINGTLANSAAYADYDVGTSFTATSVTPATGYSFSHWEDSKGNLVGESETLTLTAEASETYKAYYEVLFGNNRGTVIYDDVANDWRQGGVNGGLNAWTGAADTTRISFRTPYLLKKGETITVYLPRVQCLFNPGACTDKDVLAGDCTLASAIVTVEKKADSNTGNITEDYTVVSGKWKTTLTATKDTYVVVVVKWTQHGSEAFLLDSDYADQIVVVIEEGDSSNSAAPVGEYWETELEEDIAKIEAVRDLTGSKLSEFFFLGDVHWLNNAQVSPALINYLSARLGEEHVLFGGDVIKSYNPNQQTAITSEIEAFYRALEGYTKTGETLKIFSTLGSHDRNSANAASNPKIHLSEEMAYDLYLRRVEYFGTTVSGNPNQSCFDDAESKVRYIQFYMTEGANGTDTDTALDWVEERIMELGADWTVVLLTHGYRSYNSTTKQLEVSEENLEYKDRILGIKAAADADIACWLVGGAHVDYDEVLTCEQNDETLCLIAFGSDSYQDSNNEAYYGDAALKMVSKTVTEQSFGFVQIDSVYKKITVTRFGAGNDAVYVYGSDTVSIGVTNGTLPGGETEGEYSLGDRIVLTAAEGPKGFRFTHWENASGETVGSDKTLTLTVTQAERYKAYYEVCFAEQGATETVLSDALNDWRQGGTDGKMTVWTQETDTTRVSFQTPYLLRAGETMTVSLPDVVCCLNPGDCPDEDVAEGEDCTIRSAFIILSKNEGSETGDITQDYSIVQGKWTSSFTAEQDTYLTVMVKWDQHGNAAFLLGCDYHKQITVKVTHIAEKGRELGNYWIDELEDSISKIESNREAHANLSEFIFLTDSHWFGSADTQYSPALVNYISEKTDTSFLVFGGDIIHSTPSKTGAVDEINSFYRALEGYTKAGEELRIMTTLGNHDRNYTDGYPEIYLDDEQAIYDLYMKRMEGWGVTKEGDSTVSYYDDTQNKVRYIQFFYTSASATLPEDQFIEDAMTWAETQIKALSSDWMVVLFTHGFLPSTGQTLSDTDKTIASKILRIKAEAEAEIACWLMGHNHIDDFEILQSEDGAVKLPVISCTSDGYPKDAYLGTADEQSFSYLQVDSANKKIYLTRIGRGEDRVIDYSSDIEGTISFAIDE